MAQAGTPPSSQAPQNDNGSSNNTNPNQAPVLIAGKYKSVDEAVVASEQGYHKLSEQLAGVTRLLEGALAPQAPQAPNYGYQGVPVGYPNQHGGYGQANDPYGRGQQADQIDPAQFITNPGQFLREREERLARGIISQVTDVVKDTVGNALAVADFKIAHPEMKKHETIVQAMLANTDPRKPMRQRLEDAATLTTNYLKANGMGQDANGQGSQSQAPNSNAYVEPPTGGVPQGGNQGQQQQAALPPSDEQELVDYIRERNTDFAAKFGIANPTNAK